VTWTTRVLVIASQTAASDDLVAALKARTEKGPARFTLLLPATELGFNGREACRPRLEAALEAWRAAGLDAAGQVGDPDPMEAVIEAWDPREYDEVIVSTLPGASSRWLRGDLPLRVARHTDVQVTHVVARPPGDELHGGPPPESERSPMGPLSVLSWGGRKG
jgi:hypothetical protein